MPITEMPAYAAAYLLFLAFAFGACMGSFINCAAVRLAKGEGFARGRSHCPACGHTLSALELIPLLSWLALRGKCRWCGAPVSVRYPLTEMVLALSCAGAAWRWGLAWQTLEHCLLFCILLAMALIDLDSMELPDGLQLAGAAVFLIFLPAYDRPLARLKSGVLAGLVLGGALLVLSLVMDRLLGRESLGGGDIKLLAMLGLYTGPAAALLLVILACILGLVFGKLTAGKGQPFPFGPAIAAANRLAGLRPPYGLEIPLISRLRRQLPPVGEAGPHICGPYDLP